MINIYQNELKIVGKSLNKNYNQNNQLRESLDHFDQLKSVNRNLRSKLEMMQQNYVKIYKDLNMLRNSVINMFNRYNNYNSIQPIITSNMNDL